MNDDAKTPPRAEPLEVPDEIKAWGVAVAQGLKANLPREWGMALLLFEYTPEGADGGRLFWISTAERADMVKAVQELIARVAS